MRENYMETVKRDYVEPMVAHVKEQFKISNATLILDMRETGRPIIKEIMKSLEKANFEVKYMKEMDAIEVVPRPVEVTCEVIFVNFKKKKVTKKLYFTV